jgi:hypothetical protein
VSGDGRSAQAKLTQMTGIPGDALVERGVLGVKQGDFEA